MIHFKYSGNDVSWQIFATMTVIKTATIMWPSKFKRRVYYRALPNTSLQPLIFIPQAVLNISTTGIFIVNLFWF